MINSQFSKIKNSKLKFYVILLIYLTLLVKSNLALGSIITGQITPNTINLCGSNSQYVTITAYNLFNVENTTLTNVNANLYINGNPGLTFITNQNVNLGNINPLSYSALNPSWTIQCNTPNSGIYTAYINYSSSNGYKASSINEQTITLIIHDSITFTGNISLESNTQTIDEDYPIINDNTPTIKVFTTKNSICKGTLNNDKDYENMDFLFYGLEKDHNYTFVNQLNEGKHILYVKCKDDINNLMQLTMQFEIDSKEPIITIISPESKVLGTYAEIILNLNEIAECRYSKSNTDFNEMKTFDNKNTTTFKVKLDDLEEKTYTYFIKCKDKIGNIASKQIDFEVAIPPQASIQLEKTTLTKGTYEIKLIPTKKLKSAYLYYSFTDDPQSKREIGLVKEGNYYKGYLIIDEQEKTRQGIFSFKGIDLQDNEGTEITDGSFFIVDTIKPNAPDSLQGKNTDQGILLRWYYEGEKPEKFIIYRSTTQGITPIFYYDSIKPNNLENYYEYLDKNTQSGQLYYYRISAVDIAGNIGIMSNEISVYSTNEIKTEIQETINLPTQETRNLKKSTEKNIDSLLIDLEWAINNLNEQSTKEKSISDLNLIKKVIDSKEAIQREKNYYTNIDINEISDEELRNKLSQTEALIARTKKLTPKSLILDKSTTQLQSITNNDIELIVRELLKDQNYTESQIKKYIKEIQKINQDLKVESEIKTLTLKYLDDSFEKQIIIRKIFSYEKPEPLNDIIMIEMIPKTVAGDISSIDIKTPDYSIVKSDPIISWKFQQLSYDKQNYYYVLLANDNSESAKTTKTIAIIDPLKIINKENNLLTGFSVFIVNISNNKEYLGLIVGSLIIMVLLTYYLYTINVLNLNIFNRGIIKLKSLFMKNQILTNGSNLSNKNKSIQNGSQNTNTQSLLSNSNEINQNNLSFTKLDSEIPLKNNSIINTNSKLGNNNSINYTTILEQEKKIFTNGEFKRLKQEINDLITKEEISNIEPKNYFYAKNGEIIRGLSELKIALEKMDDFTFYYHANETKNDFAEWLFALYKNKDIYQLVKSVQTKEELIKLLEK